jgi:hypothetical protein
MALAPVLPLAPDSPDVRSLRTQLAARAQELASFQLQARGSALAQVCARLTSGLHPRPRVRTLIPALASRCASATAARGYRYAGVAPAVFSGEYVSPRNGMLGGRTRDRGQDRVEGGRIGGWVVGTATAGRDRAAVFHGRSATPHCWRALTSSLRSMLRDAVSQHWQGQRLASPHAHSALALALAPDSPNLWMSWACSGSALVQAPPHHALRSRPALAAVALPSLLRGATATRESLPSVRATPPSRRRPR